MIGHFPDPFPDELLYSVLARHAARMNYPAQYATMLELFGTRHGIPAIELPNKIDKLVSALPPGSSYTPDSFITRNTLLPFYAPFLPVKNYDMIVADMKGDGARTTQLRAGIIAGRVSPPEFFRTCPVCDRENIERLGETYWKRQHQIRGVEVCALHSVFLETANIPLRGACQRGALISAQSANRVTAERKIDSENPEHRALLQIAISVAWLFNQNSSRPGLSEIIRGYRQLLFSQDYCSPMGRIRLDPLRRKITETFSPESLKVFNCDIRVAGDGGWLGRLLRETEGTVAPLRHLLVMTALNVSAEEFFTQWIPRAASDHNSKLFPCLNKICPEFGKQVISKFELKRGKRRFAHIFECPLCGHRSSRKAEGQCVIRVVSFGKRWEHQLQLLWADESLRLRQIASQLGADVRSILKYAIKLGLEFPRHSSGRLTIQPNLRVVKRPSCVAVLDAKRKGWLKLRQKHPDVGISELHRLASALYTWLYRHDRTWMLANSPARQPWALKNERVDWMIRDAQLVDQVIETTNRIKNSESDLRRVTVRSIGLEMKMHTLLQMHKNRLPRTKAALAAHVESTEQFILRRVRRAVETLKRQRGRVNRSDITRMAGIASRALQIPSISEAVDRAKAELDINFESSTIPEAA